MNSFTRTIQRKEKPSYIDEILGRTDHFIPLSFRPKQANPGDFIPPAYRGEIVRRARIHEIAVADREVRIGSSRTTHSAKYLVRYAGGWQRPPRSVACKGHQGITYLDAVYLQHLDSEQW